MRHSWPLCKMPRRLSGAQLSCKRPSQTPHGFTAAKHTYNSSSLKPSTLTESQCSLRSSICMAGTSTGPLTCISSTAPDAPYIRSADPTCDCSPVYLSQTPRRTCMVLAFAGASRRYDGGREQQGPAAVTDVCAPRGLHRRRPAFHQVLPSGACTGKALALPALDRLHG